ncbi:MAG: DUF1735 domain-containing protein [Chitinophagaceae bacterium]
MKKIFLASVLSTALAGLLLTGCLKDKGFDNHQYGINDPDTQAAGVGFPLGTGAKAKNSYGLNVSASPQVVSDIVYVNLESGNAAPSDIQVTLQINNAVITSYNSANSANIQELPTALYTIPSLTLTIPAGQRNVTVPVNVLNTTSLNPNLAYGIGLTIVSATGNTTIASNLKDLLIEFSIKNKYDGKYNLKGVHNRAPYLFPFNLTVHLITTGPNSVALWNPSRAEFAQPIGTAPGTVSSYGDAVSPNFIFDPSGSGPGGSDLCTGVTLQVGSAVTLAMVTNDAVADANPDGPIVNRYERGPKVMYLTYQYNGIDLRRFYDTLTYIGPR